MSPGWYLAFLIVGILGFWGTIWLTHPRHDKERLAFFSKTKVRVVKRPPVLAQPLHWYQPMKPPKADRQAEVRELLNYAEAHLVNYAEAHLENIQRLRIQAMATATQLPSPVRSTHQAPKHDGDVYQAMRVMRDTGAFNKPHLMQQRYLDVYYDVLKEVRG